MGPVQGGESRGQAGLPQGREVAEADARLPLLAPLLQASAPGSAVDYPLHDLVLHTNYTATVHGLRGPNVTSPASITFITGTSCELCGTGVGKVREPKRASSPSSLPPSPPRVGGPPRLGGQGSDSPHGPPHLD